MNGVFFAAFRQAVLDLGICFVIFFFNDTATTEIYTLSLHDALPISPPGRSPAGRRRAACAPRWRRRSEEHTSELQSRQYLVCRLLLEKKKQHEQTVAKKTKKKRTTKKEFEPQKR